MSRAAGAVDAAEAAPVAVVDRPTAPGRPRRKRKGRLDRHTGLWAAFFLAPTTIGLGVFYLWPVVQTIYFSFTSWGPFGGHTFIGLDNYEAIFQDPQVGVAARNTLYFAVLGLLGLPVSLVLAATLNRPGRRGVSAYRALMFLPVVTMPAAVAIVWRWLFNGDFGIVNSLLGSVGITGTSWLSNPDTALLALSVVGIWSTVGYNMVILMAGLQAIPKQFYEAASLDGAGPVRQFTSITVPLLSPSLFFVSVLSVIGSLQTFDLVYVMIGKTSPALPQTRTIVYLFFEKAFIANDRGYAAALAFVLLLVISAITGLQFWLQKKWVHYA